MQKVYAKNPLSRFLGAELETRLKKNPRYSLSQFARFLKISPPHLSQILSGKRRLSRAQLLKLASRLQLSRRRLSSLMNLVVQEEIKSAFSKSKQQEYTQVAEKEFAHISDWTHYAILSLGEVPDAKAEPEWIAKRLGISVSQAKEAFSQLQKQRLIEVRGLKFKQTVQPLTTSMDVSSTAIRRRHEGVLELATQKLNSIPVELRDYSSITMAVDLNKLQVAKDLISDARRRICEELEAGNPSEIYTLSIQLFPLTQVEKAQS